MSLVSLTGSNDTTVPLNVTENIPVYLFPTHATAFTGVASTTGNTPIEFDSNWEQGDPDVISTVGSTVSASFSANVLSQGLWGSCPRWSAHSGRPAHRRSPSRRR